VVFRTPSGPAETRAAVVKVRNEALVVPKPATIGDAVVYVNAPVKLDVITGCMTIGLPHASFTLGSDQPVVVVVTPPVVVEVITEVP
jgi:hypothetical protein